MKTSLSKVTICFQDGRQFSGQIEHAELLEHPLYCEVVFTTGMSGYTESITDPSYHQQALVFTFPLLGLYGVHAQDQESLNHGPTVVIAKEVVRESYHPTQTDHLRTFLKRKKIPLIEAVDTRELTIYLRDVASKKPQGNCAWISLTTTTHTDQNLLKSYLPIIGHVPQVSSKESVRQRSRGQGPLVVYNFGIKESILSSLHQLGMDLIVVPYNTSAEEVMQYNPKGLVLSNGPGDPQELISLNSTLRRLVEHYPTLGICLGHQLIAQAFGASTFKMPFGHRGSHHAVIDQQHQRQFISSQNHGYAVNPDSLPGTGLKVRFTNATDGTIEGFSHETLPLITVQFHPEAHAGPLDCSYLFDEFLTLIKNNKNVEHKNEAR